MRTRLVALLTLTTCLILVLTRSGHGSDPAPANLGKQVAPFTLTDPRDGSRVSLGDLKDRKAVVVVFIGTECPIGNAFLPRLAELHQEFAPHGVLFLAINANAQDTAERVAAHARKYEVPFPVLKDEGNRVADDFDARRISEAFILDAGAHIRYRGRIDDQYGIGYQRPQPTRRDLAEALNEVLAGREVTQPTTPVAGCKINRAVKAPSAGDITYGKQVSRILQKNCQECHRPGQVGPMALLTYEDATAWSETIREVVQEGRMPPWYADPRYGHFANDRRLSTEERTQLLTWLDRGCPRGDDSDLPPARDFPSGWSIDTPDLVVSMQEEFDVPAQVPPGGIPYKYFSVDTHFTEDRWIVQAEARPGAAEVVHHSIIFIVPPGERFHPDSPSNRVLCGSAPGDTAFRLPPGWAKRIPAGSRLIFQMHYTPNGRAQKDRSSVGLVFARTAPEHEAHTMPILNPFFRIPAGADNYRVDSRYTFKTDAIVLGFMPHMHLRGKDFLYEAVSPDGQTETLLSVPHFSFGWQSVYRLTEPRRMPKGSQIHCVAHFDNSSHNPNNPNPGAEVHWGDQTWEEMMIGWMEFSYDRPPE